MGPVPSLGEYDRSGGSEHREVVPERRRLRSDEEAAPRASSEVERGARSHAAADLVATLVAGSPGQGALHRSAWSLGRADLPL
eukprot:7395992-Pyramimonas_sp.AAC.1